MASSLRNPPNPRCRLTTAVLGEPYPEYTVHVMDGSNYLKYFNYFEREIFRVRL